MGRENLTSTFVTLAMPAVLGIAVSAGFYGEAEARAKIQGSNVTCGCTCSVDSGGKNITADVTYSISGSSCSALSGSACSIEVNQQGVSLVRTGQLYGCTSGNGGAAGMVAPSAVPDGHLLDALSPFDDGLIATEESISTCAGGPPTEAKA